MANRRFWGIFQLTDCQYFLFFAPDDGWQPMMRCLLSDDALEGDGCILVPQGIMDGRAADGALPFNVSSVENPLILNWRRKLVPFPTDDVLKIWFVQNPDRKKTRPV
ncbi:MAG: hypothetical protein SPI18_06355 [Prevotella sp.]|nr:hypothetical protein [Prevotella sp.]MDY6130878.1 hypothetical protein [Prevotella sp.]